MARPEQSIRWKLVQQARERIAAGAYFSPRQERAILSARLLDAVLLDLDACAVGDGNTYRDLVAEVLSDSLDDVIDRLMVQREFEVEGGRGDIELPLRTERLASLNLWDVWARRYDVRSLLVESKNEKSQADVDTVRQISDDLRLAGRGRLGMVVARAGFTRNARKRLTAIARQGECLILPLDHNDLHGLRTARKRGSSATMELLRRKETFVLQGN